MNRREAATIGQKYFDAQPCKHDQDTRRYTTNGACPTCNQRRSNKTHKEIRALVAAAKPAP